MKSQAMKRIVDSLMVVLALGIVLSLGLGYVYFVTGKADVPDPEDVVQALERLHVESLYHATTGETAVTEGGFVAGIDIQWYGDRVPINAMVPGDQPWLDIAPIGDFHSHPPDPVINDKRQASFWYNPNRGLFRARVVPQGDDRDTLELYNEVNQASVGSLAGLTDSSRKTIPFQEVPALVQGLKQSALQQSTVTGGLRRVSTIGSPSIPRPTSLTPTPSTPTTLATPEAETVPESMLSVDPTIEVRSEQNQSQRPNLRSD